MSDLFDARRSMLEDEAEPHCNWRIVSLVSALRAAVAPLDLDLPAGIDAAVRSPRIETIFELMAELERRGIDGESLVRYGLTSEIMNSIISMLLPAWLDANDDTRTKDSASPQAAEWREALAHLAPQDPLPLTSADDVDAVRTIATLFGQVFDYVLPWTLTAPISDVLSLKPGSISNSARLSVDESALELYEAYRWMADRFSVTHLRDWYPASLKREYKWLTNAISPPCSEVLMVDRVVPQAELEAEIARRATEGDTSSSSNGELGQFEQSLAIRMIPQAVSLLKRGRLREAGALFEFALSENATDPDAYNNLGFCLLPIDATVALTYLRKADALKYRNPEIITYNLAQCYFLLAEYRAALSLIQRRWESMRHQPQSATLWVSDDLELVLKEAASPVEELARLARATALALGWLDEAEAWSARLRDLTD